MDTYPGNTSLADEVKRRIVGTYEQSLDLAERGRSQEAILGCDFVLELDPQFEPARSLRERLASGGSADGERGGRTAGPAAESPAAAAQPQPPSFEEDDDLFDLDSLDSLDVPELDPAPGGGPLHSAAPAASADGLAARLRDRLAARDFRGVLEEAGREREVVAADPELARIAETAQSRMEAQPYVETFLRDAGTAIRAGELERAEAILRKARSLDPDHPLLEDQEGSLRRARGGGTEEPAPAAPAATEDFDDLELLEGFELPEPTTADEPWQPAPSPAQPDDEDLFSLDAPELDAPELGAPEPVASAPLESGGGPARAGGNGRIGELLAEGQRAADEGDYQGAIDAWSRIFLIDVDHQEAARRIEEARRAKAERERKVEEVFHEGLAALETGETETARQRFERVVEMQPNHLAARDYLRQIEAGEPVKVRRGPTPDETVAMGGLGSFDLSDLAGPGSKPAAGAAGDSLREEILVPPEPSERERGEKRAAAALPGYGQGTSVQRQPGRRSFLLVGGLVLLLVAAAGWWLFTNKDRFFPNSETDEVAAAAEGAGAPGPIERATDLHERGQTAMAVGLLRRIRPDDPRYAEAQELVAQWEEPPAPEAEAAEDTVPTEVQERRERLLRAADTAQQRGEYLLASELYDRARQIAPLEGSAEEGRLAVEQHLEPLRKEIELFEMGEYQMLLPRLWRLYEEDPSNRDVRRMLVDSYYNRGVRELQRGNAGAAAVEFEEALEVDPGDEQIQRHFLFAQTYERRPKDLLYRIYVKYLPVR